MSSWDTGPVTTTAPDWARHTLVAALLYFPVCGLAVLPLGGAGRYLSVLAGPLALLFLLIWHAREWRPLGHSARRFAMPFLPWLAASLLVFAVYPHATIGDPFSRVLWALPVAIAAARARVSRNEVYTAAAIGALVYCGVAAYDIFALDTGRAGADTNAIIFAETAMLTTGLALTGAYAAADAPRWLRLLWLLAGTGGLFAVALTASRGPLLALLVLVSLLVADTWRRGHRLASTATTVGLLGVLVASLCLTPLGPRVLLAWTEAVNYLNGDPSVTSIGIRLELWRVALTNIGSQPLLGYGYTNVFELSKQLPALHFLPAEALEPLHHFHSDWFHALMAGGLVLVGGLGATLMLLARQARKDLARLWLLGAMVAFGLTDLAFFRKPTLTLFIAAWALLLASSPPTGDGRTV